MLLEVEGPPILHIIITETLSSHQRGDLFLTRANADTQVHIHSPSRRKGRENQVIKQVYRVYSRHGADIGSGVLRCLAERAIATELPSACLGEERLGLDSV